MWNYKILSESMQDAQKMLNQWRNQYEIEILGFETNFNTDTVRILLRRKEIGS